MAVEYDIPVDTYQDHSIVFRVKQFNLSGYTAKSQFRSNTADSTDNTLLLELSTTNSKITIEADTVILGDYLVTLKISAADSLLLQPNAVWDLFLISATNNKIKVIFGTVILNNSVTVF